MNESLEQIVAEMRNFTWRGRGLARDDVAVFADRIKAALNVKPVAAEGAVPAPSEPMAWLCDGPHGKSVHIDIRKLRAETGHTLTPLYTHPTAAIDKGALVGLVEKWRELNTTQIGNAFSQGIGQTLAMCADELRTVIDKMWPGAK